MKVLVTVAVGLLFACGGSAGSVPTESPILPSSPPADAKPAVEADPSSGPIPVLSIGERRSITSEVLGEERPYFLYLPPSYKQSKQAYPVIVLLDGDWHFHHATGLISFLSSQGRMPESIVVAIPNTVRTRDLTPTKEARAPNSGGADAFLSFIETELLPSVEKEFRTAPFRTLIGHSFGGLFAVHAMTSRPGLFDAHIAASPSLQWDDQLMLKRTQAMLKDGKLESGFLYFSLGDEPKDITSGNVAYAALLKKSAPKGLVWKYNYMTDEDHSSLVHETMQRGLRMLFDDWRLPRNVADVAAVQAHYEMVAKRFKVSGSPPENLLNSLGYRHLLATPAAPTKALEFFKLAVKLYPESANVYDSLGEAYERMGDLKSAHENYEQAVVKSDPKSELHAQLVANRDRAAKGLGKTP